MSDEKDKRVEGTVDRVTGGVVVVVIPNPDDPDYETEIYIPQDKLKKKSPKEGDKVAVVIKKKQR